jgi:hypothetical protein
LPFIGVGGNGCISVTSNVAPGLCRNMYLALKRSEPGLALRIVSVVRELTDVLFKETSPAPLKYALSLLDMMPPRVRLPLVEPGSETKAAIERTLTNLSERYSDGMIGKLSQPGDGGAPPNRTVTVLLPAAGTSAAARAAARPPDTPSPLSTPRAPFPARPGS